MSKKEVSNTTLKHYLVCEQFCLILIRLIFFNNEVFNLFPVQFLENYENYENYYNGSRGAIGILRG